MGHHLPAGISLTTDLQTNEIKLHRSYKLVLEMR